MSGLYGKFRHTLDGKGRVFLPAKMRSVLGEEFYITRKIMKKALVIYPPDGWQKLSDKLNSKPDSEAGTVKEFIYSGSACISPDSQGRILIPADLLEYAGIERDIVFVGVDDYILIYAYDTWVIEDQKQQQNQADLFRQLQALGI